MIMTQTASGSHNYYYIFVINTYTFAWGNQNYIIIIYKHTYLVSTVTIRSYVSLGGETYRNFNMWLK